MVEASGAVAPRRPRVLVVEDDPGVRRSLQLLLQGQNFDVRAYATGSTLLADAARQAPDCVIADFVLDESDGIRTLQALRDQGWYGPAILMSAFASASLEARARAAGFSLIFEKPLREGALVRAVARLTARRYDGG